MLAGSSLQADRLEEVVALVVHEDEGREVFHFDLPDGFHAQFRVLDAVDAADAALGQDGATPPMVPR